MRAGGANKKIQTRMGGIRLRHTATHNDLQRLPPDGCVHKRGNCHGTGQHLAARNGNQYVTADKTGRRRRRLGHHNADCRIIAAKKTCLGEMKSVELFQLNVSVTRQRRPL